MRSEKDIKKQLKQESRKESRALFDFSFLSFLSTLYSLLSTRQSPFSTFYSLLFSNLRKISISFIIICFLTQTIIPPRICYAQGLLGLPEPGTPVSLSPGFIPTILRGIRTYPNNPFEFDFIVDVGDAKLEGEAFNKETERLVKYFLASLTVPEDDLWVNLSPYEKDRIVPESFGQTEMGRDLLAQDYLLKQITASLINPDTDLGKEFWAKIYKKAYEQFGTTNIPVDTFNKVWIMPEKAVVYENGDKAFIVESRLKVMLEEDYLALSRSGETSSVNRETPNASRDTLHASRNALASSIIREIVIPELEKEVNEGKNFANLRQIYNSLILATWFKETLKNSILNKKYSNQNKINGVDIEDKDAKQKIYAQYLEAYKKGVCDIMKVEYDPYARKAIPRKYFSGGMQLKFGKGLKGAFQRIKDSTLVIGIKKAFQNVHLKFQSPSSGQAGMFRAPADAISSAREEKPSSGMGFSTRQTTKKNRLKHSLGAIKEFFGSFQKAGGKRIVIYDIGIGWANRHDGPATTVELAEALGEAEVFGIDNQIPRYVISLNGGVADAFFDGHGRILSYREGNSYESAQTISEDGRKRYEALFQDLYRKASRAKMQSGKYVSADGNILEFQSSKKFGRSNLKLIDADLFDLSALNKENVPLASIVRISNVLIPHYELSQIKDALVSLLPHVEEGGLVLIGFSDAMGFPKEESLVYQKTDGRFELTKYLFSVRADDNLNLGNDGSPVSLFNGGSLESKMSDLLTLHPQWKDVREFIIKNPTLYYEKYPNDYDKAMKEFDADARILEQKLASFLSQKLVEEGFKAQALGSMIEVAIEEPGAAETSLKNEFMEKIQENYIAQGAPTVVPSMKNVSGSPLKVNSFDGGISSQQIADYMALIVEDHFPELGPATKKVFLNRSKSMFGDDFTKDIDEKDVHYIQLFFPQSVKDDGSPVAAYLKKGVPFIVLERVFPGSGAGIEESVWRVTDHEGLELEIDKDTKMGQADVNDDISAHRLSSEFLKNLKKEIFEKGKDPAEGIIGSSTISVYKELTTQTAQSNGLLIKINPVPSFLETKYGNKINGIKAVVNLDTGEVLFFNGDHMTAIDEHFGKETNKIFGYQLQLVQDPAAGEYFVIGAHLDSQMNYRYKFLPEGLPTPEDILSANKLLLNAVKIPRKAGELETPAQVLVLQDLFDEIVEKFGPIVAEKIAPYKEEEKLYTSYFKDPQSRINFVDEYLRVQKKILSILGAQGAESNSFEIQKKKVEPILIEFIYRTAYHAINFLEPNATRDGPFWKILFEEISLTPREARKINFIKDGLGKLRSDMSMILLVEAGKRNAVKGKSMAANKEIIEKIWINELDHRFGNLCNQYGALLSFSTPEALAESDEEIYLFKQALREGIISADDMLQYKRKQSLSAREASLPASGEMLEGRISGLTTGINQAYFWYNGGFYLLDMASNKILVHKDGDIQNVPEDNFMAIAQNLYIFSKIASRSQEKQERFQKFIERLEEYMKDKNIPTPSSGEVARAQAIADAEKQQMQEKARASVKITSNNDGHIYFSYENLDGKKNYFYDERYPQGQRIHILDRNLGVAENQEEIIAALNQALDAQGYEKISSGLLEFKTGESGSLQNFDGTSGAPLTKGGVDFNPAKLKIESAAGSQRVDFDMNQIDFEHMDIQGLYPVIINVTPVTNLPLLMGASPEQENTPQLSLAR